MAKIIEHKIAPTKKEWEDLTQIAKFCKQYNFDCSICPIAKKCAAP